MNYIKIYNDIIKISKLKNRKKLYKKDPFYIYYEKHHIFPRCLGGNDEESNLVLLTAKEHFIAHKLLTYIYPNNRKIACAFHRMTYGKKLGINISSRDYKYAIELIRSIPVLLSTKKKLSNSSKNLWKSIEYRNNFSLKIKDSYTPEFLQNISNKTLKNWKKEEFKLKVENGMRKAWENEDLRRDHGNGGVLKIKNNIIKDYCSSRIAAEKELTNRHRIMKLCQKNIIDKDGFTWYYKNDYLLIK
jgi:hypothetical protein